MNRRRFGASRLPAAFLALGPLLLAFRCDPPPPPVCEPIDQPVCGSDGQTYANACEAGVAGVMVAHEGQCEPGCGSDADCPPSQYCSLPEIIDPPTPGGMIPDVRGVCLDRPACGTAICPAGWHCDAVMDPCPVLPESGVCATHEACVPDAGNCRTDADCAPSEHCEYSTMPYPTEDLVVRTGTCEPNYGCPPIACLLVADCQYGQAHDANGCALCECAPPPSCGSDSDCLSGQFCANVGCMCPPGAECLCAYDGVCMWPAPPPTPTPSL